MRDAILKEYNKIGYKEGINAPFNQHPHAKTMVFTPLSSMSGVTGSMGPFFCEFTLNGDILPHDYPATYAHEFAHFLGVANEGEANFYSYIVCTASADKAGEVQRILPHILPCTEQCIRYSRRKGGRKIPEGISVPRLSNWQRATAATGSASDARHWMPPRISSSNSTSRATMWRKAGRAIQALSA